MILIIKKDKKIKDIIKETKFSELGIWGKKICRRIDFKTS